MRRKAWTVVMLALAIVACLQPVRAERGPSTQEERDKALALIDTLERDPLGKDAKAARQWLTLWLIEIPDISVTMCATMLGPVMESKKNYAGEIVVQQMYSSAAFIIRNPDKRDDAASVQQAGVEGALKTYESILKSKPKAHQPFLDELLRKRDASELAAYVSSAMKDCT
jgi:carboxypeptidase Q